MTLSPVFRSAEAVEVLRTEGIWGRLDDATRGQADAVERVRADLEHVMEGRFYSVPGAGSISTLEALPLEFVQEFFFLILFRSVLEHVGLPAGALQVCSELNFCIKGTITAADNIFDDQDKSLLPLNTGAGPRFASILQLMSFERLLRRALDRGVEQGIFQEEATTTIARKLLSRMAAIGELEGSEEGGVDVDLPPDEMVERVHRVRGGALFELAFVAPRHAKGAPSAEVLDRAESAISRLGTAFQIVDDLTDFEFDLSRGSHNLLVAEIQHTGTDEMRRALARYRTEGVVPDGAVEGEFLPAARRVLDRGREEAHASLVALHEMGFWLEPRLSDELVRAIVGLDGVTRMRALADTPATG